MDSTWAPCSLGGICGFHLESMGEGKVHQSGHRVSTDNKNINNE